LLAPPSQVGAGLGAEPPPDAIPRSATRRAPASSPPDSIRLHSAARDAQARFERFRSRSLPLTDVSYGGSCDETIGRFCTWYEEREDWIPVPDPPSIVEARERLLAALDSVAALLPGDDWVLGQRVAYRLESGDGGEALVAARRCGGARPWWCAALEGYALHGLGRWLDAERAFERALGLMEPDRAARWRNLKWILDGDGRKYLSEAPPGARAARRAWIWTLADPLFLVPGNDRRTEHFARRVAVRLRENAHNAYRMPWGRDLAELLIRYGREMGWERVRSSHIDPASGIEVVGHQHPEGRQYMPRGQVLRRLVGSPPDAWIADRRRPRCLYAPPYAPVLLPMAPQVAIFPRGARFAVVAAAWLPADTTLRARHSDPRPWMEPGPDRDAPDRSGIFLVPESGGIVRRTVVTGDAHVLVAYAPAGRYLLSVERWSPSLRRTGRYRIGLERPALAPDMPALSDLLLTEPGGAEPGDLEAAARRMLPRTRIAPGRSLGVAWEATGLGPSAGTVVYSLAVERLGGGLLRSVGKLLGLASDSRALSLEWSEPVTRRRGPLFRWLSLDLPRLTRGRYRLRLEMHLRGRAALVSTRDFSVVADRER